jgi:predicted DNA-binding protein (MmcQ/YjbR family)
MSSMVAKDESGSAVEQLRAFGLRYPGAHTKSPWPGHLDLAVKDKTFAYLSLAGDPLSISCKLPHSAEAALSLPFTAPTAYGLGKSGWVTASFPDDEHVPVELLREWIDESYRAQAPKRLSAGLPPLAGTANEPLSLASTEDGATAAQRPTAKGAAGTRRGAALASQQVAVKRPVAKRPATKRTAGGRAAAPRSAAKTSKAAAAAKAGPGAGAAARRAPARRPAAKGSSAQVAASSAARGKKRASIGKRTAKRSAASARVRAR